MARNVTVTWVLPTVRESGKPLDIADIAAVELAISVDNATWSPYDEFANDVTETVVPELDAGDWYFRGVVRDTNGRFSQPVYGTVQIPDETAPGALSSLTLSF